MIEVLVALLVMALGLLGFALMQTLNLRYTQSANYRTQATNLANELVDQMRVNRLSSADFVAASFTAGEITVPAAGCPRPVGTAVEITGANGVIASWECKVVQLLGEGASANVAYADGLVTVVLSWGDRVGDDPNTSFELETRL
nr:type IV pilus modification protein PilV [Luteimonas suaedae]